MSGGQDDDSEKPYEPTPHKLEQARKKGDIVRSTDVNVAAAYAGLLLAFSAVGAGAVASAGGGLMVLLDQSSELSLLMFGGAPQPPFGGMLFHMGWSLAPWFMVPALAVLVGLFAQQAIIFTPSKLNFKASRLNPIQNAKQKFGRNGLFEFGKSFAKLMIYSVSLGFFLKIRIEDTVSAIQLDPMMVPAQLTRMMAEFLSIVVMIAASIALVDYLWQRAEHVRKNMMSHKELMDENKEAEGDPHLKGQRRQKAQEIANSQMMADVPTADVVVVNPTHYAVALTWSRLPGEAPVCVAKGVDEVAAKIREIANDSSVPIHSDPPTARALHAIVEIGQEIPPDQYQQVAAAIRFSDEMRRKAKRWK